MVSRVRVRVRDRVSGRVTDRVRFRVRVSVRRRILQAIYCYGVNYSTPAIQYNWNIIYIIKM